MDIRLYREEDIHQLVEIWLEGSIKSHGFIDKEYWQLKQLEMKTKYIPKSQTFVIYENEKIFGFISMIDHYLAALFIDRHFQKKGYGKLLLDFVKRRREEIHLKVYQKNKNAVPFYLNNGFTIQGESLDESTSEKEFVMVWKRQT